MHRIVLAMTSFVDICVQLWLGSGTGSLMGWTFLC